MIRLDQKFQHHSQVVTTELDPSEAVLLHLDNQRYYTLNETGWLIWQSLGEDLNLKEIAQKLQQDYDVEHGVAEKSVTDLVADLESEKLVKLLKTNNE